MAQRGPGEWTDDARGWIILPGKGMEEGIQFNRQERGERKGFITAEARRRKKMQVNRKGFITAEALRRKKYRSTAKTAERAN